MSTTIARTSSPKMLAAIAALVIGAAGALWVATSTGSVAGAATITSPADEVDAATTVASAGSDEDEVEVASLPDLPTYEAVALGRDPFETVRPPEPPPSAESTEPTSTATGTDPSPEAGSVEAISEQQDPDTDVCRSNGESVCDGMVVSLLEIQQETAVIQVNGDAYHVAEGAEFHGGSFQLLRISATGCVDIVYRNGDVSEVFTQCPGGTTLK